MATTDGGLNPSLSACSAFVTPCASCYLGAATSILEPPFNVTQTITVTIVPLVSGLANGQNTTYGVETITDTALEAIETGSGQQTVFGENEDITWDFNGITLTFPTTYAYFENFSAAAIPTDSQDECADTSSLGPLSLPTPTDQASYLYTPTAGIDAREELTRGILPTSLLSYLGSLDNVAEQLGGNAPQKCSPTTNPIPLTYTCLSVVPSTTCFSTFIDSAGSTTSACSTDSQGSTITVSVTAFPGSTSAAPIDKTSAASLSRFTARARFIPYTPPADAAPVPTPSPAEPQIEGPGDPAPQPVPQPAQPDPSAQNQPPPDDNNVTPPPTDNQPATPQDNPSQQDSPTTDDQPAAPEDGTSTPDGISSPSDNQPATPEDNPPQQDSPPTDDQPAAPGTGTSPPEQAPDTSAPDAQTPPEDDQTFPENDTIPQDGSDPTSPPTAEEPPTGQDSDETTLLGDDTPDLVDGSGNSPTDEPGSLTDSPPDPNATQPPDSATTLEAGTTGAGDYIASGLGASGSRTLTTVGPSETTVTVEPYTGSAVRGKVSYFLALLGVAVDAAAWL